MRLFLAPMEGVVDHTLRDFMTRVGGIDVCVTEFIRVTDQVFPERVFYKRCPELNHRSCTVAGVPVRVQLLGGKPEPIALNAAKAARLGASAIDLNFGCPAKTVNRNDGGAALLVSPDRLFNIASATRKAVPEATPVTAKMRLGYEDRSLYLENAQALFEAGVSEITVHARSKSDGYKPPAYWDYIREIREAIPLNVIANGDIWSLEDFRRCWEVTGASDFMLGRGLLSRPDLALQIKRFVATGETGDILKWDEIRCILTDFFLLTADRYAAKYMGNRLKQWLFYLTRNYPQAVQLFAQIKRSRDKAEILQELEKSGTLAAA